MKFMSSVPAGLCNSQCLQHSLPVSQLNSAKLNSASSIQPSSIQPWPICHHPYFIRLVLQRQMWLVQSHTRERGDHVTVCMQCQLCGANHPASQNSQNPVCFELFLQILFSRELDENLVRTSKQIEDRQSCSVYLQSIIVHVVPSHLTSLLKALTLEKSLNT